MLLFSDPSFIDTFSRLFPGIQVPRVRRSGISRISSVAILRPRRIHLSSHNSINIFLTLLFTLQSFLPVASHPCQYKNYRSILHFILSLISLFLQTRSSILLLPHYLQIYSYRHPIAQSLMIRAASIHLLSFSRQI